MLQVGHRERVDLSRNLPDPPHRPRTPEGPIGRARQTSHSHELFVRVLAGQVIRDATHRYLRASFVCQAKGEAECNMFKAIRLLNGQCEVAGPDKSTGRVGRRRVPSRSMGVVFTACPRMPTSATVNGSCSPRTVASSDRIE